ncbi:MAG: AbrB/MazE/SpoVT family DNA-binding domain-containing protein [Chloroflexi bacterium]|nr:AbrB/MazE/SpoVT family DNA-binding domain-containing protein [Chloroflexota bacterium]
MTGGQALRAATVTAKGQVTIPRGVREALGLKEHDRVVFVVDGDRAIMRPIRNVELAQLRGVARGRAPFTGRAAERTAAQRHVAEHVVSSFEHEE